MKVIGLTGGIASGKSTISGILESFGAVIIDVDSIGREVVSKGEKAYNKIVDSFGTDILMPDGGINRKLLGNIVFSDKEKLALLNSITHPEIIQSVKEKLEEYNRMNTEVVVIDAAILIEMGLHRLVDYVWLVTVSRETQLLRLMDRDHFSRQNAENRIKAQLENEEKKAFAHVIIDNDKPREEVFQNVKNLWKNIVSGRD